MTDLNTSLDSVRERIVAAALRAGRDSREVTLLAVTKSQPPDTILAAYDLGLRCFGENRVEEAEAKVGVLPGDIAWHMLGHIQSRKARRVLPLFAYIHSVDSLDLALRLDRLSAERADPLPILLEMNVSGEERKFGFPAARWFDDQAMRGGLLDQVAQVVTLPHLKVEGLMTMAPLAEPEQARPVFQRLRQIRDDLRVNFAHAEWRQLSMGMSDDFEVAIEEGSTLVRIGRAVFAPEQEAVCCPVALSK